MGINQWTGYTVSVPQISKEKSIERKQKQRKFDYKPKVEKTDENPNLESIQKVEEKIDIHGIEEHREETEKNVITLPLKKYFQQLRYLVFCENYKHQFKENTSSSKIYRQTLEQLYLMYTLYQPQ